MSPAATIETVCRGRSGGGTGTGALAGGRSTGAAVARGFAAGAAEAGADGLAAVDAAIDAVGDAAGDAEGAEGAEGAGDTIGEGDAGVGDATGALPQAHTTRATKPSDAVRSGVPRRKPFRRMVIEPSLRLEQELEIDEARAV